MLALLLPIPPWMGFIIYRYRGKVGLSYGYFLGGILTVLSLPWPQLGSKGLSAAQLGGALMGFTFFLQAHREGRKGLRKLGLGVGGATFFAWVLENQAGLPTGSLFIFWATALLEGLAWLLLSDLGYRLTQGRWLFLRMPAAGGLALLAGTALFRILPLGASAPLSWPASLLAGILLGLVALHQLSWLRDQGIWVEGRGNTLRTALSALEGDQPPEGPTLAYAIEARQAMVLVSEKGMVLETNTAFSRLVGLPRHQMKGHQLDDFFQGLDLPPWQDLREQLLKESRAAAPVTLVRKDSSFQPARLEAVAFDRNLALVWVVDPREGTLALRSKGADPVVRPGPGSPETGRQAVEALSAILPAVEQIMGETWNLRTRNAADRILVAAQHLLPEAGGKALRGALPHLRARPELESQAALLRQALPEGIRLDLAAADLTLYLDGGPFQRLVSQLVLHGRQAMEEGTLTLSLSPVVLGARSWGILELRAEKVRGRDCPDVLGVSWLEQTVRESLGMLELALDQRGFPWPRVFLPCESLLGDPSSHCLEGRSIFILEGDPAVRESLRGLAAEAGARVRTFSRLGDLLKATREGAWPPDLLVVERTPLLERYHGRLPLTGLHVPCLLLGDGRPLSGGNAHPSRLMPLAKPFPGQNFLQCALALLQGP